MSAGDEQREKRIFRLHIGLEKRREDVPVQVIDGVKRKFGRISECLCGSDADDETAD